MHSRAPTIPILLTNNGAVTLVLETVRVISRVIVILFSQEQKLILVQVDPETKRTVIGEWI